MTPTSTPLIVELGSTANRGRLCEPITAGVPLPCGIVRDLDSLAVIDDEGRRIPLQARATDFWPDRSIRWALLDFQVTGECAPQRRFSLHCDATGTPAAAAAALTIEEGVRQFTVNTGAAIFKVKTGASFPFASVEVNGVSLVDAANSALSVTEPDGKILATAISHVSVEERGPLRATLRLDGTIGAPRHPRLLLTARLQFFAGTSAVRVAVTLRNPKRARHQGGIWELGDHGSAYLRDVSLHLALKSEIEQLECAHEAEAPISRVDLPLEIYQDSSGGERWRHIAHVNRYNEIPCTFRGYRSESGTGRRDGHRATPVITGRHSRGLVGLAVEHFWQNWPKAAGAEARELIWRMFPGQTANEHELQGGEQKTHRCVLFFGDDAGAADARFWGRAAALARVTPEWYCTSHAVPYLTCAEPARYQQLVDAAITGPDSLEIKRERADEWGWRHFGDIHADHENAYSGLSEPVVSHYNNQYDAIAGFAIQFLRSGNRTWHRYMSELASHVTDIDIYHTDGDKSAYNHGLFWHTAHYVTAGRSSHRSFPRDPRVGGGGPANEHNYATGLRLHWLLTGDPQSREAAIELATWVITMDDGRRTALRWLSHGSTGLASQTFSPHYHGPGRGAGHSIQALLDGHRLTGDAIFLDKADELVRRCIHPADNIEALNLLDAESRWSYTVFLQVLGRYLDYLVELGRVDAQYAYGRAALLHYARWMVTHEYPYLQKPDILEYPTETWAAQDMRKCDVFLFAAGHTSGAERTRMLERARFFFNYSLSTLLDSPTRTLARPLVLILSNGYLHRSPQAAAPRPEPPAITDFGRPTVFVPQKTVAKQRLTISTGAFVLMIAVVVFAFV